MSLTAGETANILRTYQRAEGDTGSPEVQIALLTSRIEKLTDHLKSHTHDVHTRYGLTNMVSKRRRLMRYLKKENQAKYRELIDKLGIRG